MTQTTAADHTARLATALREWQALERQAIEHTGALIEKTRNPLVRELLNIIRHDSMQHHRVQQFVIDSIETPVAVTPGELDEIWGEIAAHDEAEDHAVQLAIQLHAECRDIVQRLLLDYLIYDEEKHGLLLRELARFKDGAARQHA